ncbi:MAG: glycosyltransferase family 4 protein [Acidimicrobiales bacterium]
MARKLADLAAEAGLRRIHMLAWRDLGDVEAGGSEVHAANVARLWALAGLDVTMRTSHAQGRRPMAIRDGYRVVRRAGRYMVFPRAVWGEVTAKYGPYDGLVEIWNGMPFFSPLWDRGRRVVVVHHAHTEMWPMVLSPKWARLGDAVERRLAPPVYGRSRIITLSETSKADLVATLGFRPERITVVPPGIDDRFSPAPPGARSPTPLAVAVGRLVAVKRFPVAVRAAALVRRRVPGFKLVIVGEGQDRPELEQLVDELGAGDAVELPGHRSDGDLVDLYRRSWVVLSTSAAEGWGMSLTEAAACGTSAVATDIAGHRDAVIDGETGILFARGDPAAAADALTRMLTDDGLRSRFAAAAQARSAQFTWGTTAVEILRALADERATT